MHIGSQITRFEPFVEAVIKMAELYKKIQAAGIELKHFDIGGGLVCFIMMKHHLLQSNWQKN